MRHALNANGGTVVALVGAAAALGVLTTTAAATEKPRVLVRRVATEITPVIADHISDGIGRAARGGNAAYVIELDTPGGLVTSMREIVRDILASPVPVVVYVAPSGARAASAGALITLAAHAAVMAPGTQIGAATPVGMQGEDVERKAVNDMTAMARSLAELRGRDVGFAVASVREGKSVPVNEAVRLGVVDAEASSLAAALRAVDGLEVTVGGDRTVVLATAGADVDRAGLGLLRTLLQFLANPTVSYLLLSIGTLGVIYELASPGVGVGAVALVLALFGLSVLPVQAAGLVLLAVAASLFVAELFAPGIGVFAAAGTVTLALAGLFLFDDAQGAQVPVAAVLPVAVVVGVGTVVAGRVVLRSHRAPVTTSGTGLLLGQVVVVTGVSVSAGGVGRARAEGAWWSVRSTGGPLVDGQHARVRGMDGLTLLVEPLEDRRGET